MLTILADDLTGALDSAAPFAARGLSTQVALDISAIPQALSFSPDILSVNLGSREVEADQARSITAAALAALPASASLFKKVDSRLKGNIAAELEAFSFKRALMAPAIPEFGRIVKDQYISGFGIVSPISIEQVLGSLSDKILIPDTVTHTDMMFVLIAAQQAGVDLLIGARGLAEALAQRRAVDTLPSLAEIPSGPALFVIGSRDPITLTQVEQLQTLPDLNYIAAPNGIVPQISSDHSDLTLVQATQGERQISGIQVSDHLAAAVYPALTTSVKTLLLSGGETANSVLKAMGIKCLRLEGECLPGLALAYADGLCIIAKSGGFGSPDTLKQVAQQSMRKTKPMAG